MLGVQRCSSGDECHGWRAGITQCCTVQCTALGRLQPQTRARKRTGCSERYGYAARQWPPSHPHITNIMWIPTNNKKLLDSSSDCW